MYTSWDILGWRYELPLVRASPGVKLDAAGMSIKSCLIVSTMTRRLHRDTGVSPMVPIEDHAALMLHNPDIPHSSFHWQTLPRMTSGKGPILPYKRKFSRGSNFRYFRERFENAKICLHEKLYFKRKFRSWYWYDILLHTLSYLKSKRKSFGVITIQATSKNRPR